VAEIVRLRRRYVPLIAVLGIAAAVLYLAQAKSVTGVTIAVTRRPATALNATMPRTAERIGPRGGIWADIG